jgi:hypothetical protein
MRLPPSNLAWLGWVLLLSALTAPAQSPIPVTPPKTEAVPQTKAPAKKPKLVPKKARHGRKARLTVAEPAKDNSQKVVVQKGGTSEALPQMAPVAPQHQDTEERRKAGQLLTATDANLQSLLGKTLTKDQQSTVALARQFMGQARTALDAGDLKQGYTLASKANTLSEELVKP